MLPWQSVERSRHARTIILAADAHSKRATTPRRARQLQLALGYKHDHQAALKNLDLVSELDGGATSLVLARRPSRLRGASYILIGEICLSRLEVR